MSQPVLVAVDFSPDSESAFAWALEAAVAFGNPLLVLHVVHVPADDPGYYVSTELAVEEHEQAAQKLLDEFVERMLAKHPQLEAFEGFESRTVVGLPVTRILEVASDVGARLIVMGGRGRTGLADVLLGSKVENVARLARVPVVIVRSHDDDRVD